MTNLVGRCPESERLVVVVVVAAVVSYEHAYALVRAHGEDGWTARLVPVSVDGLIYASSMVMLQSARREAPVPALALWLLALGILATLVANVMHGLDHGPVGAVVAAWPAIALVGSYELLMTLVRGSSRVSGLVSARDPLQVQAADTFAGQLVTGRVPSIRAIRSALHVGQPRAQEIQTYLAALAES